MLRHDRTDLRLIAGLCFDVRLGLGGEARRWHLLGFSACRGLRQCFGRGGGEGQEVGCAGGDVACYFGYDCGAAFARQGARDGDVFCDDGSRFGRSRVWLLDGGHVGLNYWGAGRVGNSCGVKGGFSGGTCCNQVRRFCERDAAGCFSGFGHWNRFNFSPYARIGLRRICLRDIGLWDLGLRGGRVQ